MAGADDVDLADLQETEIVAVADLAVLYEFKHLLLGKRREEQAVFNLVAAVLGLEEGLEFRHVVAREHLLREVADAEVPVEVLLQPRPKGVRIALQVVVVQDGVDGEEGEDEDAAATELKNYLWLNF